MPLNEDMQKAIHEIFRAVREVQEETRKGIAEILKELHGSRRND